MVSSHACLIVALVVTTILCPILQGRSLCPLWLFTFTFLFIANKRKTQWPLKKSLLLLANLGAFAKEVRLHLLLLRP